MKIIDMPSSFSSSSVIYYSSICGVSLVILYYVYTRFYGLFAIYNCLTTNIWWKWSTNQWTSCLKGPPQQCRNLDPNGIYGFCFDPEYYGVGVGEPSGPYGYSCADWVFQPDQCYPETCELANTSKRFGWCEERQRAYRGTSCGPDKAYGISCQKWLWEAPEKCPKKCPAALPRCAAPKKVLPKCATPTQDQCLCE
jgi:hypothetical protein